ncbi:2-hydroxyhepta-2,4-diene-1,7-dioate isomerase [Streptomyces viridochromogenes]|uniref:2-hydroxyhepta-2,4-diene-1,7-dioate isomerase n=1 Tax=Streptomyces viridochromogenes TaxID=1938 RepID=A0A0J7Z2H1_STRVR|nr:fumarylacetoacetate hydrolase family protein [Streptomyces viridochromogenes]KMS69964.1 2-hydroxyhepta-2,4-diene-1,7-dioate isomerase [Streptomyces viridochromogenes]KOG15638.1 2-hydroxyhepta-2,4-diene-1,7-dioate isomerase [Streptomyces viridochromogenes]KOG15674.1 2-hydroxyhepta-2,4-diene-1,7-dioate isomerase [Streptomyces viridochromogenes]
MRLATIRTPEGTRAVRIEGDAAVELGHPDVGALLSRPGWRAEAATADGRHHDLTGLDYAPPVPSPEKIVCVGLNYRNHILEMGRELPEHPTLFAKFARAQVGAYDPVVLPAGSDAVDWEAELGVYVGAEVRHATPEQARAAIAGYTVVNDVTGRDFQYRSPQWLQGKTFEASTPVGPWLVVAEPDDAPLSAELTCTVDGQLMQKADTGDLVFDPAALVAYISRIITLVPGDLIATGTPGGVGHARKPPRYLTEGSELVTAVEGVGECRNTLVRG